MSAATAPKEPYRQSVDEVLAALGTDARRGLSEVEEGRAIFSNIRKFLRYLLSSNIGEVRTMFFGVLLADRIGRESLSPICCLHMA